MKSTSKHLSVAAVATMLAVAGPGVALATDGAAPARSSADITLADCLLESSKEISYVEYLDDGTTVAKDESVESETLDLTSVEGIEDVDAVAVKAGTTVESFSVACTGETEETPEEPEDGAEDGEDKDDVADGGTKTPGPEEGRANPRSTATITLAGCTLESSKDISYVAYLADGSMVTKDESMNSETFDLTTVEDVAEYDAVQVKSGTTVESFAIACGDEETAPVEGGTTEPDAGHEDESESGFYGEASDGSEGSDEPEVDGERGHDEAKHQEKHQARVSENHDEAKHQAHHRGGQNDSDEDERAERETKRDSDDAEREHHDDEDGDDLDS